MFGSNKNAKNNKNTSNAGQSGARNNVNNSANQYTTGLNGSSAMMSPKERKRAEKAARKAKRKGKWAEKLDMYDMILSNIIAGSAIIEPDVKLESNQIDIGYSSIAQNTQITKYFLIKQLPDYLAPNFIDQIRQSCIHNGVKINFYFYCNPYKINWESAEMKNKLQIWEKYANDQSYGDTQVFKYRANRSDQLAKRRIIESVKYLNQAELDYKRRLLRTMIIVEFSAHRDDDSLIAMSEQIKCYKETCQRQDIKTRELQKDMISYLRQLGPFSLYEDAQIDRKLSRKIFTDDILANFNSYKQGRVGTTGVQMGIDVLQKVPVMRKFKARPTQPENWLIQAETGGGKSYFVKQLLTYLLADGFVVTVMDYEGDEYTNLANYIRAGNPEDVRIIQMGKGSTQYFDPCEIPMLTGDPEVDDDLKDQAIQYILQVFRVIACGLEGEFTQWEERIMQTAIQRMYDNAGVTDAKETWVRQKGLYLRDVYQELKYIVESKEMVDQDNDNIKHKAAIRLQEAAQVYFEPGQSKSQTFANPMPAEDLFKAKFIVFSFGMKGAASTLTDPTILALKQLQVASIAIQIQNYCKYVRHCFNVKVWEEYQRWGQTKGQAEVIQNAMTGGRKRGDVNIIITNDLQAMLDDNNPINERLRQNIQSYAIGRINDKGVRHKFCDKFDLQDCEIALDKIAKAPVQEDRSGGQAGKYKHAFCIIMDNGKKAIAKVELPPALKNQKLFETGVDIKSSDGNSNNSGFKL